MTWLTDRLQQLTDHVRDVVYTSDLDNAQLVTVSNTGTDFLSAKSQAAGAVIIYPFPKITYPRPKTRRVTWTLGVVANGKAIDAANRCSELLAVLETADVVAWRASDTAADPTDFAVSEDPRTPKIPGWAITITEEHMP